MFTRICSDSDLLNLSSVLSESFYDRQRHDGGIIKIDSPEQQVIENVFELDTRPVSSAMTLRGSVAWFDIRDSDESVRVRIVAEPFSTYSVCDGGLDNVVGYVDAKDLFQRVLNQRPIVLTDEGLIHKALVVPDRLSLAEVLAQFRQAHEDFSISSLMNFSRSSEMLMAPPKHRRHAKG